MGVKFKSKINIENNQEKKEDLEHQLSKVHNEIQRATELDGLD